MEHFSACFGEVVDPRAANARHDLLELMFVALAATLCGAEGCTDMTQFARSKLALLREVVPLEHGPPSHDTFSRVFRLVEPEPFEAAFARFTAAFAGSLKGVVAMDGKALREAYDRGGKTSPMQLVNIWAAEARLVIGQRLAPGRNEGLGARQALALLDLKGCIVTADALHCRADTAQAILDTGADYALALKDNQPGLLAAARALLDGTGDQDEAVSGPDAVPNIAANIAHDRIERRRATVVRTDGQATANLTFPGLAAVARVETQRKAEAPLIRWYLLFTPLSATRMIEVSRAHWTIENQLHWVLDVAFDEDAARSRKDNAPQNLALIRKLALNILRMHPDKGSIRLKIKRAGWDDNVLRSLIGHMR